MAEPDRPECYTGTAYLQPLPDIDVLYQASEVASSPSLSYPIHFTSPGTYTLWFRGYPANGAGDSLHLRLNEVLTTVTGFAPGQWGWRSTSLSGQPARIAITATGLYTLSLWAREDGLRLDRLLLSNDTGYTPAGFGPVESNRVTAGAGGAEVPLARTIVYTYDGLYRLAEADYSSGENYQYGYDAVGNRLEQIINGDTTEYLYDAANRLASVTHLGQPQPYTYSPNGNLLRTGVLTNSFDGANRLISSTRSSVFVVPVYNGVGDRVKQTVGLSTTYYALDVEGLPEVVYTSEGNVFLHLPGVIVAESSTGETRYLLGDGLGSIRQATDETGAVVAYNEFDPYGNPLTTGSEPYGFTGEWWQAEVGLLHLRARWYLAEAGTFLSRDAVESEPPYQYVRGNSVNYIDPSGYNGCLLYGSHNYEMALLDDCDQGTGGGGIPVAIALGYLLYQGTINVAEGVQELLDEWADIANEAWENWRPEPEYQPTSTPPPFPVPTSVCTPDDDYKHEVLTVGDGNYEYSNNLYAKHLDWKITATSYGDGSNSQVFVGGYGNLEQYTNVDATKLESGRVTGNNRYDAIILLALADCVVERK